MPTACLLQATVVVRITVHVRQGTVATPDDSPTMITGKLGIGVEAVDVQVQCDERAHER